MRRKIINRRRQRPHPAKLRATRLARRNIRQQHLVAKRRQLWRFICIKKVVLAEG